MKWTNRGHEYDDIGYKLKGKKTVYIYGYEYIAKEITNIIENSRKYIDWELYFVDKDIEKQKSGCRGYKVLSPEEFFLMDKKNYFVIVAPIGKSGDEIYNMVVDAKIDKDIIFRGEYFLYTYLPIYFAYIHDIVFFTSQNVLPTTVCNLKCRDCLNFTPFIKKHKTYTIEQLKENVDIFFNAVDYIYRFQITGGEPLLYKNIAEFIEYIDKNYREKIIRFELVTNATIIPSDEFCKMLHDKDMYVFLDDYTRALDENYKKSHNNVFEKFKKFDVSFFSNRVDSWIRMYTPEDDSFVFMKDNLEEKFSLCRNPWSTIREGRISSCNYSNYAYYAGISGMDELDEYDLRKFTKDKKKELIEFRTGYNEKGYVSFCSKCNGFVYANKLWSKPAIQINRG